MRNSGTGSAREIGSKAVVGLKVQISKCKFQENPKRQPRKLSGQASGKHQSPIFKSLIDAIRLICALSRLKSPRRFCGIPTAKSKQLGHTKELGLHQFFPSIFGDELDERLVGAARQGLEVIF